MYISMRPTATLVMVGLLLMLAAATLTVYAAPCTDVIVRDLKMYVDGEEYFVKGMNYSPEPLGWVNITADGLTGSGLCGAKDTVFGFQESACLREDEFDFPFWEEAWKRDLPLIQELGVNTIRLYHMNHYNKEYVQRFGEEDEDIVAPDTAGNHVPFLDMAHDYGLKVIVPIVEDEALLVSKNLDELKRFIMAKVDALGDHPALLMWAVGNELGLALKPQLRKRVNWCIHQVRMYMAEKWGRRVPVTTFVIDLPTSYEMLTDELVVDVFSTNAGYRHLVMQPLWTGEGNFMGWKRLSEKTGIPLLIGEIGMHNNDIMTEQQPDWPNQLWKQVVDQQSAGCLGALYYVYSDSPRKPEDQQHMGFVRFLEREVDGVSSLDLNSYIADDVERKDILYNGLKEGYPGSDFAAYNLNADPFDLSGVQRSNIDISACPEYEPYPEPEEPPFVYPGEEVDGDDGEIPQPGGSVGGGGNGGDGSGSGDGGSSGGSGGGGPNLMLVMGAALLVLVLSSNSRV